LLRCQTDAELRQSFEKAISHVGGDILTANNTVWSRYRTFEHDEAVDLMETATG
jgi:hypothetical protein